MRITSLYYMNSTVLLAVFCCWIAVTFVSYQYFLNDIIVTETQDVFDIHLIRNHKVEELPNVDPERPVNRRTEAELLEEIYARRVEERQEANEIRFRDSCKHFTLEGEPEFEYTVHRNIFGSRSDSFKSTEITVISQCSDDRIDRAVKLLKRWPGPISLTIYMTQERTFNPSQFESFRRTNVFLHVALYKTGQPHFYPTNFMRNVALDNAPTELIFFVDIDFAPFISSLYDSLVRWTQTEWFEPDKTALVVPSFSRYYKHLSFAQTKEELLWFAQLNVYLPFELRHVYYGDADSTSFSNLSVFTFDGRTRRLYYQSDPAELRMRAEIQNRVFKQELVKLEHQQENLERIWFLTSNSGGSIDASAGYRVPRRVLLQRKLSTFFKNTETSSSFNRKRSELPGGIRNRRRLTPYDILMALAEETRVDWSPRAVRRKTAEVRHEPLTHAADGESAGAVGVVIGAALKEQRRVSVVLTMPPLPASSHSSTVFSLSSTPADEGFEEQRILYHEHRRSSFSPLLRCGYASPLPKALSVDSLQCKL